MGGDAAITYLRGPSCLALLVEELARSGRLAVCKVALWSRERLSVLRLRNGILVMHTLHWPEEIRDPGAPGGGAEQMPQYQGVFARPA
ncbi:Ku protein [Streptomyces caniferus]|uniref:Ku protein n=1 Tax=Streptomyces caniferus TaxID=285557 RepID=UPI003714117A